MSESVTNSDVSELLFEDALEKLEDLVREMESDRMPLDQLMKNYELATMLHQVCENRLDEAQGRIEIIRKRKGKIVTEEFGAMKENGQSSVSESSDNDDDASNQTQEPISHQHGELF